MTKNNADYVIAGDTDSIFLSIESILEHMYGDIKEIETDQLVKYTLELATEFQEYINNMYNLYAIKCHNTKNHNWFIKQELIASSGLFMAAKKRYALWIINKKGTPVDKIEVKGIDVVRSNYPKAFREFTKSILTDILHDKDKTFLNKKVQEFGYLIKDSYIFDIMLPTGVKEISKWKTENGKFLKGTPVHVKAAMNYNTLLDQWGVNYLPKISDGDKIQWCYLNKNEFGFDTMALTGDNDPLEFVGFVAKYIDKNDLFENTLKNKLQSFWDALGWGAIISNENINKFFKFN